MKPNLPLTSKTRQLKEVGETTRVISESNPTSPERGGTLTRRHSRRRSEESNSSGTLKRRQAPNRGSVESMSSSTSTPTPSAPGTPLGHQPHMFSSILTPTSPTPVTSPLEMIPSCMTDSMLSLPLPPSPDATSLCDMDSLPPPPDLCDLVHFTGSQISLASISIAPPPPELKPIMRTLEVNSPIREHQAATIAGPLPSKISYNSNTLPPPTSVDKEPSQQIYAKTMKPSLKAPPYKAPPSYNGQQVPPQLATQKSVTFAESPVLLRRKVCFEDQVMQIPISPRRSSACRDSMAPLPPPRAEATRLSISSNSSSNGSPKRLSESPSNPPRDFLKDLQRVMKKKWQVSQKCKMEPTTSPHEVLGFRDISANGQSGDYSSHYYRETVNVSNWVQEHYGKLEIYLLHKCVPTFSSFFRRRQFI